MEPPREPPREPPWFEHEKVWLLAEIIKVAPVPSEQLLRIIRDMQIAPRWNDIHPPHGRSVSSCQMAFHDLTTGRTPMGYTPPGFPPSHQPGMQPRYTSPEVSKKRPLPPEMSLSNPMGRILQPRPPLGGTYLPDPTRAGGSYTTSAPMSAMTAGAGPALEPPLKKKRGRPTKAEAQARADAAAARGEMIAPLRGSRQEARPAPSQLEGSGQLVGPIFTPTTTPGSYSSPPKVSQPSSMTFGAATAEQEEPTSRRTPLVNTRPGTGDGRESGASGERGASSASLEGSPGRQGTESIDASRSRATPHPQPGVTGPGNPPAYEPPGRRSAGTEEPHIQHARQGEQEHQQSPPSHAQQPPQQAPQQHGQPQTEQQGQQKRSTPHSFKETVGM